MSVSGLSIIIVSYSVKKIGLSTDPRGTPNLWCNYKTYSRLVFSPSVSCLQDRKEPTQLRGKSKGAGLQSEDLSSDFTSYPRSLDLLIRVLFQLYGEHTVLQPFRCIELIVYIVISVLPGTHFHLSQVKHLRVKCLAQGHNILIIRLCPKIERGET